MNICEPIKQYAGNQPELTAIVDADRTINYRELDDLVDRSATRLLEMGVVPGDRVGLCLQDNAHLIIAVLAVARIGAIVLPIDWRARPQEKEQLVATFRPRLVVIHPGSIPLSHSPSTVLDDHWYDKTVGDDTVSAFSHASNIPVLLNLSSGSTGTPKATVVTHGQLCARFVAWWTDLGLKRGHRYFSSLPLNYSFGRNYCLYSLIGGNTVILSPPLFAAEEMVQEIAAAEATVAIFVPTMLRKILQLPETDAPLLPGLEIMMSGAAPLHPEEKREVMRRVNSNLFEIYGATGAGVISVLRPGDVYERADSVGQTSFLTELQIVDDNDLQVPNGTVGRIRCRGPQVASGFCNETPGTDTELFTDGWCYTGERAAIDAFGYLRLSGRVSELIVRAGFNIYPEEVERVLAAHPAVAEASVTGIPSSEMGEDVVGFVVIEEATSARDLFLYCRRELSSHKVPSRLYAMEELPKTNAGKVARGELVRQLHAGALHPMRDSDSDERGDSHQDPETVASLEFQLAEIWKNLLGREVVGSQEDFFHLGGESLLAMKLFNRIASITGVTLPFSTIFEVRTIAGLVKRLREELGDTN